MSDTRESLIDAIPLRKIKVEAAESDNDETLNCRMCDRNFLSFEALNLHAKMVHHHRTLEGRAIWSNYKNHVNYSDLEQHEKLGTVGENIKIEIEVNFPLQQLSTKNMTTSGDVNDIVIKSEISPLKMEHVEELETEEDTVEKVFVKEERETQMMFDSKNVLATDQYGHSFPSVYSHEDALSIMKISTEEYNNKGLCEEKLKSKEILNSSFGNTNKLTEQINIDRVNVKIRTPKRIKEFICNVCGNKCNNKRNLKNHIKIHTGKKVFACHICDYKCTRRGHLNIHIKTHIGDKPFACHFCDYKCIEKSKLILHIRTHTGEKPFACHLCNHKSNNKSRLKSHIRAHTGEKPFACPICDYKCNNRSNLRKHMRKHSDKKPFSCHLCEYKCNHSSNLKNHMSIHTGEKLFSCHICDYKCNDKSKLKRHIRTHTGEKPFGCHICDYKCIDKSKLNNHIRTHTG